MIDAKLFWITYDKEFHPRHCLHAVQLERVGLLWS